jgi:hypothetical protein
MSDRPESAATRLWQDWVQLREQERNEAQTRARIAEQKVAVLTAENERLATEDAQLRCLDARRPWLLRSPGGHWARRKGRWAACGVG